jgi:N-acetyl-gamma-glutamyl-phosphate reductase
VCRLLAGHPSLRLAGVHANSSAGRRLGELQPHLLPFADLEVQPSTAAELAGYDVVVLALPHGESAAVAAELSPDTLVIDCGADHRLEDPAAWTRWYGSEHAGTWPYGLPELPGQRERLAGARRIAVPGCYPTSVTLAMAPALAAGLVAPDVVVVAATGTSGAGKSAKPHLIGSEVMGSVSAYGVGGVHRHTPEMVQNLAQAAGGPVGVSFTPMLVPMSRGILATCSAPLTAGTDIGSVRAAYEKAYADEPFVHLLPEGQVADHRAGAGRQHRRPAGRRRRRRGRLVVIAAVDNLTKGTGGSGGAVRQPGPGPAGDHRPAAGRGRAVSVTAPRGLPGRRRRRRAEEQRRARRRAGRQRRPAGRRGRVFTTNRFPAAPVLWSRQVLPRRGCGRSSSTPAAPTPAPVPEGFATPTPPPSTPPPSSASGAIDVAVASTGLIGVRLPMDGCSPASPPRRRRCPRAAGPTPPGRS